MPAGPIRRGQWSQANVDMDGLTVARSIMQAAPATKIVMVTLDASPSYREEATKLGLHGYVIKGASGRELLAVVRHSLQR